MSDNVIKGWTHLVLPPNPSVWLSAHKMAASHFTTHMILINVLARNTTSNNQVSLTFFNMYSHSRKHQRANWLRRLERPDDIKDYRWKMATLLQKRNSSRCNFRSTRFPHIAGDCRQKIGNYTRKLVFYSPTPI